jgi:hypothetical protein
MYFLVTIFIHACVYINLHEHTFYYFFINVKYVHEYIYANTTLTHHYSIYFLLFSRYIVFLRFTCRECIFQHLSFVICLSKYHHHLFLDLSLRIFLTNLYFFLINLYFFLTNLYFFSYTPGKFWRL